MQLRRLAEAARSPSRPVGHRAGQTRPDESRHAQRRPVTDAERAYPMATDRSTGTAACERARPVDPGARPSTGQVPMTRVLGQLREAETLRVSRDPGADRIGSRASRRPKPVDIGRRWSAGPRIVHTTWRGCTSPGCESRLEGAHRPGVGRTPQALRRRARVGEVRRLGLELLVVEPRVQPARASSSRCVPRSTIRPRVEDEDQVRTQDRREPMGDRDRRPPLGQRARAPLDQPLAHGVERDVASSRIRIRGSLSSTRAIAIRCFSPPESL